MKFMFLNGLTDSEKSAFYTLAKSIIAADESIADREVILLTQYLQEMRMTVEQVRPFSFDEAVGIFTVADSEKGRQIYIELFALAMCDAADFAPEEAELLSSIAAKLDISEKTQNDLQDCVLSLLHVYGRMNELIKG